MSDLRGEPEVTKKDKGFSVDEINLPIFVHLRTFGVCKL
jgi:hypothetical protein